MKRLFLLLFAGLFVWGACVREDQTEIPPVDPKEKPTPNPTPTPPVLFTLEAASATVSDYVVGHCTWIYHCTKQTRLLQVL